MSSGNEKLFVTVATRCNEKILIPLINIKSIKNFYMDSKPFFKSMVNYTKGGGLAIQESLE